MSYLRIHTVADDSFGFPPDIEQCAEGTLYCKECFQVWEEIEAIDVVIDDWEYLNPRVPFTFFEQPMLPVVHSSFLDCFRPDLVARDLYLGRVYIGKGVLQPDWFTVRSRHRLIVRGTEHVSLRWCEACGRPVYYASAGFFLYPEPAVDVAYFTNDADFVVRPDCVDIRRLRKMRRVALEEIPVVDAPLDGYGVIEPKDYRPPPNPRWELPA